MTAWRVPVVVESRWRRTVVLTLMLPLAIMLPALVPPDQREVTTGQIALVGLATFAVLALVNGVLFWHRGRDSFVADEDGLHLRSTRRGERHLAWSDLVELGWVLPGRYQRGGLAGRTRIGGRFEPGGPAIAGWLSRPTARVGPPVGLPELCEGQGIAWRSYLGAEVM